MSELATSVARDSPTMRNSFVRELRAGVAVSGALLLFGLLAIAWHGSAGTAGVSGVPPLSQFGTDLLAGQAWTFLWLGVAVLALTPVVRVAFALVQFAQVKDRDYVGLTAFVLAVLGVSLLVGVTAA
ncbi:MAG: DUF1634 domain-containing protein [Thermoplasmata archaeon]|nr:DUF1634 domain-containing protein [Thermoplasmata archaeon]